MIITEKEFNAITGEEIITQREESPAELAEREAREAEAVARAAAQAEAEVKRQALIDKLGITEDEARLLLN